MRSTLSILIPGFTGTEGLAETLRRIPRDLWGDIGVVAAIHADTLAVPPQEAASLQQRYPKLRMVSVAGKSGYGMAVRRGLGICRESVAEYAVCLGGQGDMPPELLVKLLAHMENYGMDLLQASRTGGAGEGHGPGTWMERALLRLENRYLSLNLSDSRPGCLVYSRRALRKIPFERLGLRSGFDLEVIASARQQGLRVGEIRLALPPPREGAGRLRHGMDVLKVITKFRLGYYRSNGARGRR